MWRRLIEMARKRRRLSLLRRCLAGAAPQRRARRSVREISAAQNSHHGLWYKLGRKCYQRNGNIIEPSASISPIR